jgi:uncharacterized protein with GYD domain
MWFIILAKFRRKPTKQDTEKMSSYYAEAAKWGVKRHSAFWTLGRYDAVFIIEAPDEKTAMKFVINTPTDLAATETLVAITREDALKLMQ